MTKYVVVAFFPRERFLMREHCFFPAAAAFHIVERSLD